MKSAQFCFLPNFGFSPFLHLGGHDESGHPHDLCKFEPLCKHTNRRGSRIKKHEDKCHFNPAVQQRQRQKVEPQQSASQPKDNRPQQKVQRKPQQSASQPKNNQQQQRKVQREKPPQEEEKEQQFLHCSEHRVKRFT